MRTESRLSLLALLPWVSAIPAPALDSTHTQLLDWNAIPPSRDLTYHKCYDGFQCARLEVPLDWVNDTDTRTAVIAIIKLPAVVPDSDPSFGGSILVNPGGPGVPGVPYLQDEGRNLQRFVDKPGRRHYEIVSWDPRGIGHTTPSADCFRSDISARSAWLREERGNGGLEQGLGAIRYGLSMTKAFSQRCQEMETKFGDVRAYVNTPSVARDMVQMVDKIEELRKKEGATGLRMELKKWTEEPPRLQYIGSSYGTLLGNYFASLYPGRVGRMVLDGVANADDYANGPGWLSSLEDTDELFGHFWQGCHQAGPSTCSLASALDASGSDPEGRFWSWVASLDDTPLPVVRPTGDMVILRGDDIRRLVGIALYDPIRTFRPLANALHEAMTGNTTGVVAWMMRAGLIMDLNTGCKGEDMILPEILPDAQSAVLCGDGDDITGKPATWWHKYVQQLTTKSRLYGGYWAKIRFRCSSWPFRPNLSFKGPFTTPVSVPHPTSGYPAAPLLFLSNRLDPVTPLRSARAMAANHPGAALVVQESLGHCAIGSAPSTCTRTIVADYFESGTVPSKETVCQTQCGPWDEGCSRYPGLSVSDTRFRSAPIKDNFFALPARMFPL